MNEFKEFETAPTLTLEPFGEEMASVINAGGPKEPEKPKEAWDDSMLSEESSRELPLQGRL